MIDGYGVVYKGTYTPEDNLDCKDGKYAAHCKGGNTGRIGISVCCMKDKNTPPTKEQIETLCTLAAHVCKAYKLTAAQVLTHAEFDPKRKIDINYLPHVNLTGVKECSNYLRKQIQKEMDNYG